jgi:general secretion pathway protein A
MIPLQNSALDQMAGRVMYTHFYGFSEEPFRDVPDPNFLFLVPGHERTLNCLIQGIEKKSGWLLLSGDVGSGKTLFIHHLLDSYKEKPQVKTAFVFQPRVSFEDLLKEILAKLHLPSDPSSGVSLTRHFQNCLARNFTREETLLLFFDEAQDFSVEMLENIYRFFAVEVKGPCALQLVFSGQSDIEDKLQSQPLRLLDQKITVRCQVKSLTRAESQRYLDHRLRLVGANSAVFAPEALTLITKNGEGIPRALNNICDNSFRIGHRLSEAKISADIVRKALGEMFLQKGRLRSGGKMRKGSFFSRNIPYFLAIMVCLGLLFWVGKGRLHWNQGPPTAKVEDKQTKLERPAPAPGENNSEATLAKEAASGLSVNQRSGGDSVQISQGSSAPLSDPESEVRIMKVVTVRKGITLNQLCVENYGLAHITLLDHIMRSNPRIINPHLILVNERIKLPEIDDDSLLVSTDDGSIKISLGTFGNPDVAGIFKEEQSLKGKEISVLSRKISARETWYRFTAGNFKSGEEARKVVSALKGKGLLPFIPTPAKRLVQKS